MAQLVARTAGGREVAGSSPVTPTNNPKELSGIVIVMEQNKQLVITYTNWKHETRERLIEPIEIWFGATRWHPEEQWLLKARDLVKNEERDFAMTQISAIRTDDPVEEVAEAQPVTSETANVVKLFTDGGSRGNPGPSAIGYVILDMADTVIEQSSKYLGITTNNQAEYQGLKEGLEACRKINAQAVHAHMDSLLVINQMKGIYQVKNRDLWPIHDDIKKMLSSFKSVTFTHVPRELNKIADSMVNECLDSQ